MSELYECPAHGHVVAWGGTQYGPRCAACVNDADHVDDVLLLTDEQRLPTREQIANRPHPTAPSTCVVCWNEDPEPLENGVCDDCRRTLGRRGLELAAENAKLRQALNDCTTHPMDSAENLKARIRARKLLDA